MVLVLVVAVLAVGVAVAVDRERLVRLHVRAVRLLVAAAVLQTGTAVLVPGSGAIRAGVLALTAALVGLFLGGNWRVPGVPLVACGLFLNALVITVNGAMPVSLDAADRAGLSRSDLRLGDEALHEVMNEHTRLRILGDTVPVVLPARPQVVSPGDVLAAAGLGLLLLTGAPRRGPAGRTTAQKRAARPAVLANESSTRGSYS